jgi:SAUR family protein
MCKVINTVQPLVWLRRAVRRWRWRSRAAASVRPDKDKESTTAVPAGHVAVRVEGGRFVVRLAHLSHPAFRELLRQAEEEYGFASNSGPLMLPCDVDRLRDVLRRVSLSFGSYLGAPPWRRAAAAAAGYGYREARLLIDCPSYALVRCTLWPCPFGHFSTITYYMPVSAASTHYAWRGRPCRGGRPSVVLRALKPGIYRLSKLLDKTHTS